MLVDKQFLEDVHNSYNCIGCHGGVAVTQDKKEAHKGIVKNPSDKCADCHGDIAKIAATSLHKGLYGYITVLEARGADFTNPNMQKAYQNHCAYCHADCSHCHISRPIFAGGGLIKGHLVKKIVSIRDTCLSCHSARVGAEYMGLNEGIPGSVHWERAGMNCFDCHRITNFHGDGTQYAHRYDGKPVPSCLDCHPDVKGGKDGIKHHVIHDGKVDCYVCHVSGPYKSCYNCHVIIKEGMPTFRTAPSKMTFKIGLNPNPTEERPYKYVLLRHIPVDPDTFATYGDNLLPNFNAVPTWKYTTPHNIVRNAPQTKTCNSCHGNKALFLTAEDVAPEELEANKAVIVKEIPKAR